MAETSASPLPGPPPQKKGVAAWAFYDWANSAFPTVIGTFVFSTYFTKGIAETPERGTELWGYALSLSALCVAILSPLLGAVADRRGGRKGWVMGFTLIAAVACALLWRAAPDTAFVLWALVCFAAANLAFELAAVFYNAMLPDLAGKNRIGRVSGWAWGLGYAGGLACLALVLVLFVQAETPILGLDKEMAEHVRATGPFVAAWMLLFALPFAVWTPDTPRTSVSVTAAIGAGLKSLRETLANLPTYRDIAWFLFARMIYIDGLNTLFAFGGIYAAGTFGFALDEVIIFGIAINVTAGLGAAAFGWLDDKLGPKPVIVVSVLGLCVFGGALLVVEGKTLFWIFALPLGLFVGPTQAASRSLMAHLAPAEKRTEMFGLYALSGKATAFLGPALLGFVTAQMDSQRWGMATLLIFFIGGLLLLRKVPNVTGRAAPA